MPDLPMKTYWMGEDIEQLPREKLLKIIRHLAAQIDTQRRVTQSIIETNNMFRAARAR